ncbi:SecDF P1 head subdomain-containing protein [Cryobacterium sp. AP23]
MVVLAVLALSACSGAAGVDEPSSGTGGQIEMTVAETCTEGSDSPCVLVNGQNVLLPDAFEEAGVADSSVAGNGQNAVDVTFTADGAAVLHELTEQAVGAGDQARLVIRIGGELQAAVVVMETLKGDQLQIGLSPDENAQELVDMIKGS